MSQAGRRLVRRLAAEHVQRQATSSTAGAAVEAAAGRRGVASASGRQTSDEAAASRGGRVFLNALLGGSALSLVYNYHAALRSAILAETGLLGITEPLIEAGAHMAAGEGGVQRERLLARRGMSKTVDGFYNPAGLPKFYEAFTELADAESDILIIRLRFLAFMPNNSALRVEKEEILNILKRRGVPLPSLAPL